MLLEERIDAFNKIGDIFCNFQRNNSFKESIEKAQIENPWFLKSNIQNAFLALAKMLNKDQLHEWSSLYNMNRAAKTVGVIIPANIPLVGFYDFLCVLLSGNIFIGKLSLSNTVLLPFVAKLLCDINPKFENYIFFQNNLDEVDLLIATGNDNSADYFNFLFEKKRKIIRKNRNSVAVLNGNETDDEYKKLSHDIYMYFGLGCRNISKLFVPRWFDFNHVKGIFQDADPIMCQAYLDNYNYQKAILNMNSIDFLDFDNLLLVESTHINSPISVLYYQYYDDIKEVDEFLDFNRDNIQCVVGHNSLVQFGNTQIPLVFNSPDNIDVMRFLTS
tara:strand:+ start:771 stop:1763 length:993 start_codon:yes stop_codon:yes gene_type:complete